MDKLENLQQGKPPSPVMAHISLTNACNLTCSFCCFANRDISEKMPTEKVFQALLLQARIGTDKARAWMMPVQCVIHYRRLHQQNHRMSLNTGQVLGMRMTFLTLLLSGTDHSQSMNSSMHLRLMNPDFGFMIVENTFCSSTPIQTCSVRFLVNNARLEHQLG